MKMIHKHVLFHKLPYHSSPKKLSIERAGQSVRSRKSPPRRSMAKFIDEKLKLLCKIKAVRWATLFIGILNLGVICLSGYMLIKNLHGCGRRIALPVVVVAVASAVRIISMIGTGLAQEAAAATIICRPTENLVADAVVRHERRITYVRWLWWARFGAMINFFQLAAAAYLLFIVIRFASYVDVSERCLVGKVSGSRWNRTLMVFLVVLVSMVVIFQCLTGTDVLRWRSFYATCDSAWKAHYQEVFDHGIREALCCMGRVKYLSVLEKDEVYSVAKLLGDLVAYRASGTGHLELLAGMALLQSNKQVSCSNDEYMEAPESLIREAATFHPFAEAAYTGPLLDFGRNPILFPCAWLYRQGVLTPWTRSRRPVLEGDNWLRGHAAAFLKSVHLSPQTLRQGRVSQAKCEAAYFVVVLHHLRSVVIAIRGTETPEDLLTDGLCSECALSMQDLDGVINSQHLSSAVKRNILSSFPHYAHSGIVEAARELFIQLDGHPVDAHPYEAIGFLSMLLGDGCECQGYCIRIVGHSLGGSIGAMLGIRLYHRYPNLHVYSYGTLPCVDFVVGEACSSFVTSIIYNDEFSSRLSVNSILRLRAAAVRALSEDAAADSDTVCRLARKILLASKYQEKCRQDNGIAGSDNMHSTQKTSGIDKMRQGPLLKEPDIGSRSSREPFSGLSCGPSFDDTNYDMSSCGHLGPDLVCNFSSSLEQSTKDHAEMYLPGLLVHIVPEKKAIMPLWRSWSMFDREWNYKAYVADRKSFGDIIISPYMFLDHLPWRCQLALQRVLECQNPNGQVNIDILSEPYVIDT